MSVFNQLTNSQFEEIMCNIPNGLYLKVICGDVFTTTIFYPEFEFTVFTNNSYQFGHKEFDDENNFQNIIIDADNICTIHRCNISPLFDAEQIIVKLLDDVELILQTDNC